MSKELIFNRIKELKLGEMSLIAYQNDLITLFDPIDLVNKVYEERGYNRNARHRIFKELTPEASEVVLVREGKNGPCIEKRLFTVQGIYQLIFLLNTKDTITIRRNFVNIIEKYRRDNGLEIEEFLVTAYKENMIESYDYDRRDRLETNVSEEFYAIPNKELFIRAVHKFPVLNNMVLYGREPQIDEIPKIKKGVKLDYYLNCKSVINALSRLLSTDQVTILIDQLKADTKVYQISLFEFDLDDKFTGYYNGTELLDSLIHRMKSIKKGQNIMHHLLEKLFTSKEVIEILYDSVTKFNLVSEDLNIDIYNDLP